jgi:hypothetical protein
MLTVRAAGYSSIVVLGWPIVIGGVIAILLTVFGADRAAFDLSSRALMAAITVLSFLLVIVPLLLSWAQTVVENSVRSAGTHP